MDLLNFVVLLFIPFARASPSGSFNGTAFPASDTSSCADTRTLSKIIWNCAATIFACTWTAIHPNVPGRKESTYAIIFRHVLIMVLALIAPELVIVWAARQSFSARKAADDFNLQVLHQKRVPPLQRFYDRIKGFYGRMKGFFSCTQTHRDQQDIEKKGITAWTETHGFFAWMGGFMLYVEDTEYATLTPTELLRFIGDESVDIPDITEEEIQDRSKRDALSKVVAIIQLAWFIIQFVARYLQHLSVTLLEIDTLAVTILTCVTYYFWLKKPKDVRLPSRVYWRKTEEPKDLCYPVATTDTAYYRKIVGHFIKSFKKGGAISNVHRGVASIGDSIVTRGVIILCISGIAFGVIHCLGWNVLFQGQIVWRVASLVVLCTPVPIFLFEVYVWLYSKLRPVADVHVSTHANKAKLFLVDVIREFLFAAVLVSCVLYIIARITIIVLLILSLRSLPPGAYETVVWTKFFPHL